jgi:DNA polymerase III epsilon subunit-like protein
MVDRLMALDFMVDLETMGNGPTAAIVQIGCVVFDRDSGEVFDEFKVNVDLASEVKNGFTMDASTAQWWMGQSAEGKNTWVGKASYPSKDALTLFVKFVQKYRENKSVIWSHSTFDAPILMYHFGQLAMKLPIRYAFWLDLRTLSMLGRGVASIPKEARPDDAHDAVADCYYQVKWLVKCWNALKGK